jgi:5-methylcytosine-specific restriction protein B
MRKSRTVPLGFVHRVETEIGPLLDEYWYDAPEQAREARGKLLAELS